MNTRLPPLHYNKSDSEKAFHRALQKETARLLKESGDHRFADTYHLLKALLLTVLCIVSYALLFWQTQAMGFFICYFLFVMMGMLLNVNVNHEASHSTFLKSSLANRIISRIVTLPLGVDPTFWRERHVFYHHRYPNIEHYDLDTEENGFLRQTPFQQHRSYMRYQQHYWPVIAALSLPYISWVFDWTDRLGKTALRDEAVVQHKGSWPMFIISKSLHFFLVLILPAWVAWLNDISLWVVIFSYLASQMLSSLMVVFLLLGTHWAQASFYDVPGGGEMPHGWYQHNFLTACDWLVSPSWVNGWLGGLNMHLTHHLFPGWHHRHYPALAAILQKLSAEHGMQYRCITYRELIESQRKFLQTMGRGDA